MVRSGVKPHSAGRTSLGAPCGGRYDRPEQLCELIAEVEPKPAELGVTAIVVTHDIQSAFMVGDRIAFLHDGKIRFDGTVEEAKRAEEPLLRSFLEGGGYG